MNIDVKNLNPNQVIIDIEGVIGVDESSQFAENDDQTRVSTYEKFRSIIEQINTDELQGLRLNIRSAGGSVQDALLIYSLLQELGEKCEIETHCYGFSASAATIIAQAASPNKRFVANSALYMIHNSSTQFDGNAQEAESVAEMLAKIDGQIAELYSQRSGRGVEHFAEIMARDSGRGEWLTAQEAVEYGLADEVENYLVIKNFVSSIKGLFKKIFSTPENHSLINPQNKKAEKSEEILEEDNNPQYLLIDKQKTETQSKEDPTIEHFAVLQSENQGAYNNDIALFKDR